MALARIEKNCIKSVPDFQLDSNARKMVPFWASGYEMGTMFLPAYIYPIFSSLNMGTYSIYQNENQANHTVTSKHINILVRQFKFIATAFKLVAGILRIRSFLC